MYTHNQLQQIANELRIDIIKAISRAKSGHPGGSLSAIDILVYLFFNEIKRTKENALDPDRHRFVLSKGHGVPALYAILARIGLISYEELMNLRVLGSRTQGHPSYLDLPYVEASTGSLGQGLSVAIGMALAAKIDKKSYRVYCMTGDGETQEGQIWEAILSAPKFNLDNLCVILDYNKSQIDGFTKDVMDLEPLKAKLEAFKWNVLEIDGHNFAEIENAFNIAREVKGKPTYIIAHTIKGKGVSFMEDNVEWHGKAPNEKETELALQELQKLLVKNG
ncbi:MAG: transketolase [Ignavibacteria bacterium]|jgi:transketolase|nr:transketolase [Ignavibacteria bacterium]MDH7527145.1 transketolase [Ignavibacteria bacterium]